MQYAYAAHYQLFVLVYAALFINNVITERNSEFNRTITAHFGGRRKQSISYDERHVYNIHLYIYVCVYMYHNT